MAGWQSASLKQRQKLLEQKIKEEAKKENVCDDCKFKTWADYFENRNPEGLPITLRCPYYENGKYGILRGTKACSRFEQE